MKAKSIESVSTIDSVSREIHNFPSISFGGESRLRFLSNASMIMKRMTQTDMEETRAINQTSKKWEGCMNIS